MLLYRTICNIRNAGMLLFAFFFVFFPFLVDAQLCNGNLGDPIVNIDFGDGHTSGLPAGSTDYTRTGGCPKNGEYTIHNFLFGCADNTWFIMTGDHGRTTVNGNYMLVNGAGKQGLVIKDTARNLCGSTAYEFAGWVTNVMQKNACGGHPGLPNLTFTAETLTGTILGSYTTGDIPVTDFKTWKKYGFFFKTPPDASAVVIFITSNTTTDCGSAFALDDITLKACGPAIKATLDGADITHIDVCAGYDDPFVLNATYTASYFTDPVMQWQNSVDSGITWRDITGAITDTYSIPQRSNGVILYRMVIADKVNFNSPQCRISTNPIWTNVHPGPVHQPTADLTGCLGKDYMLSSPTTYILKYLWQGPNGFISDFPTPTLPDIKYADTGIYSVLLTADFGCTVKDSFYLHAFPSTTITAVTEYNACEGNVIQLSASGEGTYQWTPSAGLSNDHIANPFANPSVYTQYKVVLTNTYGCKDSAFVNVHVNKNLQLSVGRDKQILLGDTATIDAFVSGTEIQYHWSPPLFINDINAMSPKVFPPASQDYTIYAVSNVGCGNKTATVKVKVLNEFNIPSAFTPNGDGKNDVFHITALDNYIVDKFLIYNRWGTVIFETKDLYKGWDGNVKGYPQQTGSYIYYLKMRSKAGAIIVRQGTIVLIR